MASVKSNLSVWVVVLHLAGVLGTMRYVEQCDFVGIDLILMSKNALYSTDPRSRPPDEVPDLRKWILQDSMIYVDGFLMGNNDRNVSKTDVNRKGTKGQCNVTVMYSK